MSTPASTTGAEPLNGSSRTSRMRRRIHEAARRAFAARGMAVQVDDVVKLAGVARGTFYNYFSTTNELFEQVAAEMARDMIDHIYAGVVQLPDPALRISNGIRHFCLKAHAQRDWGLFLAHFGLSTETLQTAIRDTASRDIEQGIESGRFQLRPDQALGALAFLSGAVLSSIKLVVAGLETPLRAGENAAELTLRAFGVAADEASRLAREPLVQLAD